MSSLIKRHMFYKEYIFLVTHFCNIKDNPYLSGGTNMGFVLVYYQWYLKNKGTCYGPITNIGLSAKWYADILHLFFFKFYFIFKLYKIVLVLPNIKMNPPQVYMCSPSWTLLPPPSPFLPSGLCQCTSPKCRFSINN